MSRLLLPLLLLGGFAAAQDEDSLAKVKQALRENPAAAESLAERISRSPIAGQITRETEPGLRKDTIRDWILADPDSAAQLAAGLAQDDAEGGTNFQDALRRSGSSLEYNPGSRKNLYNRLRKSGADSKLLGKQAEELSSEEKREILKTMFEGRGSQNQNIITQQDQGKPSEGLPGQAYKGYFDRLSQGNLRGYSPELMALQSALNLRRPPGAPKLIESGKLDYATLSYPGYGMRFDIGNLEARLRLERKKDPLLEKRAEALKRASAALDDFNQTALAARDPARISKALLAALGAKQREAARWITVASLEEELQRLESEEGFLTPELLALIDACPFPATAIQAYKKRGESFRARLLTMKANSRQAVALLESDAWSSNVKEAEKSMAQNAALRKDLFRNIRDFVNTPYRLADEADRRARWRRLIDELIMRWLPSHPYARKLKRQARRKAALGDVFLKIAGGDLDAAHAILSSYEPPSSPL